MHEVDRFQLRELGAFAATIVSSMAAADEERKGEREAWTCRWALHGIVRTVVEEI
jgi:hypothetical protein